eukprot:CAMPEP_0169286346 /NCGR_PEP_ID=MMETSP1016-20121227/59240_1 /TAXON_ID=342587 /ORGANISM="Karlodinium micrum, Strain CCMP2283" /LENGTH=55 /DNA_ID=CAMNT_0009376029 /DNA_START=57 /DNA_END=221 /DNA_ORIENTATION=-
MTHPKIAESDMCEHDAAAQQESGESEIDPEEEEEEDAEEGETMSESGGTGMTVSR